MYERVQVCFTTRLDLRPTHADFLGGQLVTRTEVLPPYTRSLIGCFILDGRVVLHDAALRQRR